MQPSGIGPILRAVLLTTLWVAGALGEQQPAPTGRGARDYAAEEGKLKEILAGGYNSLGLLYFEQGKFSAAAEAFARAAEMAPEVSDAQYNLGLARLRLGQNEQALDPLGKAVKLDDKNIKAREALGEALFQMDRFAEALPHLEAAHAGDRDNVNLSYTLAVTYSRLGRPERSVDVVKEMLKRDEDSPELHLALARIYRESQRLTEALREVETALRMNPQLPLAHYEMGLDEVRLDRMSEACEEFKREIAVNSTVYQAYYALAQCSMNVRQNFGEAIRNFERVIALRPGHVDSFFGLAKAHFKLGEFTEAEGLLHQVLELDVRRPDAHYLLAQVYQKSNRTADATREFSLASKLKAQKREKDYRELQENMSEDSYSTQ